MNHVGQRGVLRRLAAVLRRRVDGGDDSGAAMMMVLLAMMIATALSLMLLGTIMSQTSATVFDRKNVRTVHAAEAGIDVALGRIRAATSPDALQNYDLVGDRTKLPCTVEGLVQGSPGEMRYEVEISYYQEDPATKDESWRGSAANRLACIPGSGLSVTPKFALIKADGSGEGVPRLAASAGDRRLETIYDFRLTNQNIVGGVIRNYQDGNAATLQLCWDAGSATPAVGKRLTVETCNETLPQQLFAWRSDFTITLAMTQRPGSDGLCVEVSTDGGSSRYAALQPCTGTAAQKLGFNDNAHFLVKAFSGNWCPTQPSNNARGQELRVTTAACGEGQIPKSAWQPSPLVGAGSVGNIGNSIDGERLQWVNYAEFGRCFDVTNWSPGFDWMIAYPCKQIPGESVGWNQTLQWDAATKQLFTRSGPNGTSWSNSGTKYCVTAPTASNGYVTLKSCVSGQANQKWTINRELPGNYTASYTVVDHAGRCMSVGPRNSSAGAGVGQWSSIIVANCNGSGQQKWNAPPDPTKPVLRDTRELNG